MCADVVFQEPVGNDHVDPGRLHELCNLDLLDVSEVHDELERQVAGVRQAPHWQTVSRSITMSRW